MKERVWKAGNRKTQQYTQVSTFCYLNSYCSPQLLQNKQYWSYHVIDIDIVFIYMNPHVLLAGRPTNYAIVNIVHK